MHLNSILFYILCKWAEKIDDSFSIAQIFVQSNVSRIKKFLSSQMTCKKQIKLTGKQKNLLDIQITYSFAHTSSH